MAQVEAMSLIDKALESVARDAQQIVRLPSDAGINADNFEYADLLKGGALGRRVGAVIEKDGAPLIYVANVPQSQPETGRALARLLGNRAETALLLDVHEDSSSRRLNARAWACSLDTNEHRALNLSDPAKAAEVLGDLQEGLWSAESNKHQEQRLRDLLVRSVDTVSKALLSATLAQSRSPDVLALVGRALFTRFLLDRGILAQNTAPNLWRALSPDGSNAFSSPENAAQICDWLDRTFNGEFLPLGAPKGYLPYFKDMLVHAPEALKPLNWIVGRTDAGGQLPLWDRLDFSYIPTGTLSEVYEDYARSREPLKSKRTSVHFTPRHIARMMVRQAFSALPKVSAASAKVLDPAVGAAVFLSLSFRELARRHADAHDGNWPDTEALRGILYGQLRGMDINGDALNLAALTLYLTAIELDANPVPPEKLRFKKRLLGTVLHDVGDNSAIGPNSSRHGSLGKNVSVGKDFQIVIGNPPWTSIPSPEGETPGMRGKTSADFTADIVELASNRLQQCSVDLGIPYEHPDKVPDLAFLWKATEWAAQGAVISFVVHQRLLIKRSDGWRTARRALFSSVEVNGILDGGEFANHDDMVWPGVESPFCILFARNKKPNPEHRIHLLGLAVEPSLNKRRHLRLDPLATMAVRAEDFDEAPGGLIPRMKGSELDQLLLDRWNRRLAATEAKTRSNTGARRLPLSTLSDCLSQFALDTDRRGFKTGKKGTTLKPWFKDLPPGTKELRGKELDHYNGEIDAAEITTEFEPRPVKSCPDLKWFKPPLLLIRQAVGQLDESRRTLVITPSKNQIPVMYPFAFLGFPLRNKKESLLYAKYVGLWVNSSIFSYFQTLTSTQFGFQIKALLSEEIRQTPILPMPKAIAAGLTTAEEIERLFAALSRPSALLHSEIDDWAHRIIGSTKPERQLIADTLSVAYPIGLSRNSGCDWVSDVQIGSYVRKLQGDLSEFNDLINIESLEAVSRSSALPGWRFIKWNLNNSRPLLPNDEAKWLVIDKLNDAALLHLVRMQYPRGQIWAMTRDGTFLLGQLALQKCWLPSRTPLVTPTIIAWADQCAS